MHVHTHLRELIFLRKNDCLGCAVLLCLVCLFVCLTLLASFFLPSHLSLKHIKLYVHVMQKVQYIACDNKVSNAELVWLCMYVHANER